VLKITPILILGPKSPIRDSCVQALSKHGIRPEVLESLYPLGNCFPDKGLIVVTSKNEQYQYLLSYCKELGTSFPIIAIIDSDDPEIRVNLLETGADDVLPADKIRSQLVPRIKAVLRRYGLVSWDSQCARITVGSITLNTQSHKVTVKGRDIKLSPTECKILQKLMLHADRIVPHADITSTVWGEDYNGNSEKLRVYIRQIRQKLCAQDPTIEIINHPGIGYMLSVNPTD